MDLKGRNYFTDNTFDLLLSDTKRVLSRSYFSDSYESDIGWYAELTKERLKEEPKNFIKLKESGFTHLGEIIWPTYKFNKFGFRSDDWSDGDKGIIFLGCSDTVGVGNYNHNTFAALISEKLGVKNYNLGVAGGGLDQAYRVLKYHINDINSDYVCLLIPSPFRREFYTDNSTVLCMPTSFTDENSVNGKGVTETQVNALWNYEALKEVYFSALTNRHYVFLETNKTLDAIRYICEKNNKKLIEVKNPIFYTDPEQVKFYQNIKKNPLGGSFDIAADLTHHGRIFQKKIANLFMEKL